MPILPLLMFLFAINMLFCLIDAIKLLAISERIRADIANGTLPPQTLIKKSFKLLTQLCYLALTAIILFATIQLMLKK